MAVTALSTSLQSPLHKQKNITPCGESDTKRGILSLTILLSRHPGRDKAICTDNTSQRVSLVEETQSLPSEHIVIHVIILFMRKILYVSDCLLPEVILHCEVHSIAKLVLFHQRHDKLRLSQSKHISQATANIKNRYHTDMI